MNSHPRLLGFLLLTAMIAGCTSPATESRSPVTTLIPTSAPSVTLTSTLDAELAADLDAALTKLAEKGDVSGSVLVARDGQVILSQAYGLANIELKTPNTPETKFHIGSLTKQFTAMAVLLLQQQGKVSVQEPVCKYVEDCPAAWQSVTIHQLLTHTSGIHEFDDTAGLAELVLHPATPLQLIAQFRDLPLDFTPGEKFAFSNSGYFLLGYIIEKVSGQTYAAFLQQNIFDPLKMKNSGYDDDQHSGPDHALGYENSNTPATYVDKSIAYAAAGLYSTVGDLLLWDQALYTNKLLPASLQDEMFRPFAPVPGSPLSSGYGWFIGQQFDQPWLYSSGGSVGFVSEINRFPASKVTIIILTNRRDTDLKGLNALIAPMIFGGVWVSPWK